MAAVLTRVMIKAQSISPSRLSTFLLIGLAAILCNGCATDGVGKQAAYDRKIQRTEQLLIAAGDADSLAAIWFLHHGDETDRTETIRPDQNPHLLCESKGWAPAQAKAAS